MRGAPLMVEDGVDQLLAPPAPDDLVMDEMRLPAHPEPFQETRGGRVLGRAAADDPVQAQRIEPQPEHDLGRLGGQAPAVVVGVEDEPDLALPVLPAQPLEADLADDLPVLLPDHRVRQPVTVPVERDLTAPFLESLLDLGAITGVPVQIAGDIWPRLVVVKIVKIARAEWAQSQPGRLNGALSTQHPTEPRSPGSSVATRSSRRAPAAAKI